MNRALHRFWKRWIPALLLTAAVSATATAEEYAIDTKGQHAFIQFKVKHLGYSWILGGFRKFDGSFTFDANHPEHNKVRVTIDAASIDTNHAERDKHLRSPDFFDVTKYPKITYVSTGYEDRGGGRGVIHGKLTLRGITKPVDIAVQQIGAGKDPWGGFRRGFEGHAVLHLADYKMPFAPKLGPVSDEVRLFFSIEGVRR
ncbi:MAG: YceI family protein [Zetaproteobacteria bacterium]|nr:MAG: YceI family protein [Zetaproteobacteria bacterium]